MPIGIVKDTVGRFINGIRLMLRIIKLRYLKIISGRIFTAIAIKKCSFFFSATPFDTAQVTKTQKSMAKK